VQLETDSYETLCVNFADVAKVWTLHDITGGGSTDVTGSYAFPKDLPSLMIPSFTFTPGKSYLIALSATLSNGVTQEPATATHTVSVSYTSISTAQQSTNMTVSTNQTVNVKAVVTDPDGTDDGRLVSYVWRAYKVSGFGEEIDDVTHTNPNPNPNPNWRRWVT